MAKREGAFDTQLVRPGPTSTEIIAPDTVFERIQDFYPSEGGGLVSVARPHQYHHKSGGGAPDNGAASSGGTTVYGTTYGVHHARIRDGSRDILLLQTDDQVWEFHGWDRQWRCIIGPDGLTPAAYSVASLPIPTASDFPTQFVTTPTGVVIVPPGGRAHFYDGTVCRPLGYDVAPGPPIGLGPEDTSNKWAPDLTGPQVFLGVNDSGYTVDAIENHGPSMTHPMFRYGRLGTVETPGNVTHMSEVGTEALGSQIMGYLRRGVYRAVLQYLDLWGNRSPLSPESNEVRFSRQPAMKLVVGAPYTLEWTNPDSVLKQAGWDGLALGPIGTIGRIIGRTTDMGSSGDTKLYELPIDASVNPLAYATIPDNMTRFYPDNIPDSWLQLEVRDVEPMPLFKLAALAFGRLWVANAPGREGALWRSWTGRWGTIEKGSVMFPDPSGSEITGLHGVNGGLMVFTSRSTYLISQVSEGVYQSRPLSSTVGCVAPSSIKTLRNGETVWLARDGFYSYSGSAGVTFAFAQRRGDVTRFSKGLLNKAVACFDTASGEYRCWVATDGSARNNKCFTYNGVDWHTRTDMYASGACVTDDPRQMNIVCGYEPQRDLDGVWVMDHWGAAETAVARTSWLNSMSGTAERTAIRTVYLWLRETGTAASDANKIAVKVRRDYRAEVLHTKYATAYPALANTTSTNPSFWDSALLTATSSRWRKRRPFWIKVDIDVGQCEAFQLEITSPRRFELLGLSFEAQPRQSSGNAASRA